MRPSRRGLSGIAPRILLFNALVVFVPVLSFLLLGSYERGLLESLEHALAQQARVVAAWLGASPLDEAAARAAIAAIGDRRTARFRVLDARGFLLADSSDPPDDAAKTAPAKSAVASLGVEGTLEKKVQVAAPSSTNESLLYKLFSLPARVYRRFFTPPARVFSSADFYGQTKILDGPELRAALSGRYGAATRVSSGGQVSVTLYSAVPILEGGRVVGAVLVSQSTYRILRALYAIRFDSAKIFAWSLAAACALSLLLSLTILRPVKKLRLAVTSALLSRDKAGEAFPDSVRRDEIGELGRAFKELVSRLDERIDSTERFASDAAHEFRNPLASIRSAAEMAERSDDPEQRRRFLRGIVDDAERLSALIGGLRGLSRIGVGFSDASRVAVSLGDALRAAATRASLSIAATADAKTVLCLCDAGLADDRICAEPARLASILDNLIDNAVSFAALRVTLRLTSEGGNGKRKSPGHLVVYVEDDGPGIPAEHLDRVFDRFFTWRPQAERRHHTGLGLSLAKALIEAEGGDLRAENRTEGGARFVARFPSASFRAGSPAPA